MLGRAHVAQFFHQLGIEGGGHADGLGIHGGHAGAGHAVERFVPPVVGGHAQPLDGGGLVAHLGRGFFQCHLVNQRAGALPGFFTSHNFTSSFFLRFK